jgi:hypothetical protein
MNESADLQSLVLHEAAGEGVPPKVQSIICFAQGIPWLKVTTLTLVRDAAVSSGGQDSPRELVQ